jgi:hypothetical protein
MFAAAGAAFPVTMAPLRAAVQCRLRGRWPGPTACRKAALAAAAARDGARAGRRVGRSGCGKGQDRSEGRAPPQPGRRGEGHSVRGTIELAPTLASKILQACVLKRRRRHMPAATPDHSCTWPNAPDVCACACRSSNVRMSKKVRGAASARRRTPRKEATPPLRVAARGKKLTQHYAGCTEAWLVFRYDGEAVQKAARCTPQRGEDGGGRPAAQRQRAQRGARAP